MTLYWMDQREVEFCEHCDIDDGTIWGYRFIKNEWIFCCLDCGWNGEFFVEEES